MIDPATLEAALTWIEGDPDPDTRAELQALVDAADGPEVADRMAGTLEFGTAGLRGVVGAGSNRMNRAVVIRATAGLADHLHRKHGDDIGRVVVGRDARPSSAAFMDDTVAVFVAAGIDVSYFEAPVPTPLVAHAALHLGSVAGVVITASHNPPADNGYKVYDDNGAQIIPPTDSEIAAAISAVGPATSVPRASDGEIEARATPIGAEMFAAYLADIFPDRAPPARTPDLKIAYTPMHGVGGSYVVAALARAGYVDVHPVVEQFEPDGTFPTVRFPNPEEPGALDLSFETADRVGADLIIANDPDTDRLAIAVPRDDGWQALTGNQIGALLGDHLLRRTQEGAPFVVSSIVSSPMLGTIAASYGARFVQSLTGFKWICNAAIDLEASGGSFVFGYEEALGYAVTTAVRDKDGISAAVAFADLAATAIVEGTTVLGRLEELYRSHGLWVSTQVSIVRPGNEGAAEIRDAMDRISAVPPDSLRGVEVTSVVDYSKGAERRPRYLPATKLVELEMGGLGRLLVRPSGTEPKLKIYADLRAEAGDGDVADLEDRLLARADELGRALAHDLGFAD